MPTITPHQLELYLNFFDIYETAIVNSYAKSLSICQNTVSVQKALESSSEYDRLYLIFKRAKAGANWLDDIPANQLQLFVMKHDPDFDRSVLKESLAVYRDIRIRLKSSHYWGIGDLKREALDRKFADLIGREHIDGRSFRDDEVENSINKLITSSSDAGRHGAAITNAYVAADYIYNHRLSIMAALGKQEYQNRLLKITRHGAYLCQTVGQWKKFEYFFNKTKVLAEDGSELAKIVLCEHKKHLHRKNRLVSAAPFETHASEALARDIEMRSLKKIRCADPILLLNAVDEFTDFGLNFTTDVVVPHLTDIKISDLLSEINEGLEEKIFAKSLHPYIFITIASCLADCNKLAEAENILGKAALIALGGDISDTKIIRRGLFLAQAKIEDRQGKDSADSYFRARELSIDTGAFHIARGIDMITRQNKA